MLFPDQLWQQRFAQRVQRLKCKKCANVVSIDGRSSGSGSDADLEEEAEATVRMLLPSLLPESWAPATSEAPRLSDPPTPAPYESPSSQEAPAPSCIESRVTLVTEPSEPGASARTFPLTRASSVRTTRSGEGRRRWLVLSGLAVMALLSVRGCMLGSADSHRAATLDLGEPSLTGAPDERGSPASALVASAPAPEDATEVAAGLAPLDSPNTADSSEPPKKLGADARGLPSRRAAKKTAPSAAAAHAGSAMPYDKATLAQALSAVLQNAERCDLWGRATGTAKLFVTFAPTGKVSDASLVGEPLESAAVARCILHHARAASLPPFAGPAFTISRKITLR